MDGCNGIGGQGAESDGDVAPAVRKDSGILHTYIYIDIYIYIYVYRIPRILLEGTV